MSIRFRLVRSPLGGFQAYVIQSVQADDQITAKSGWTRFCTNYHVVKGHMSGV